MTTRFDCADPIEREEGLAASVVSIRNGEVIVLPTDTVYGVAADAFSATAVTRLLVAKGRGRQMPPPVLIGSTATLDALTSHVPDYARALVGRFWPGALTLIFHEQSSLQWDLGDTRGTVAVRMPDHDLALAVLDRTGPLAVSSANRSGMPAATDADGAQEMLGESIALLLDGGPTSGNQPSTILDCTGDAPQILRHGALAEQRIVEVLEPLGVSFKGPDSRA